MIPIQAANILSRKKKKKKKLGGHNCIHLVMKSTIEISVLTRTVACPELGGNVFTVRLHLRCNLLEGLVIPLGVSRVGNPVCCDEAHQHEKCQTTELESTATDIDGWGIGSKRPLTTREHNLASLKHTPSLHRVRSSRTPRSIVRLWNPICPTPQQCHGKWSGIGWERARQGSANISFTNLTI